MRRLSQAAVASRSGMGDFRPNGSLASGAVGLARILIPENLVQNVPGVAVLDFGKLGDGLKNSLRVVREGFGSGTVERQTCGGTGRRFLKGELLWPRRCPGCP